MWRLISHATRHRKMYSERGRYVINYKYSTLPRGISLYIALNVGIFPEAGGRGKYSLSRVQYMPAFHKG